MHHHAEQSPRAIVYCEQKFGTTDGKTANGLVRFSGRYTIMGVIDSAKAGRDAGEVLDGSPNGIPIYKDFDHMLAANQTNLPGVFIYGIAPPGGKFSEHDRHILFQVIEHGLDIVSGLHEFLTDDAEFVQKAQEYRVSLYDIRKPRAKKDLVVFSNRIQEVMCPKIAVLGTDCAIGKRTSSIILTNALREAGIRTTLVATGQTALIQGFRHGASLDAIPQQFISGELERAVLEAYEEETPELIIIEGQGALSHPAFSGSCFIIRGSRPDAIILQCAPNRLTFEDYPTFPIPSLEYEIHLIEVFSGVKVIGITLNHEGMTHEAILTTIQTYEQQFGVPAVDLLHQSSQRLVQKILSTFPQLKQTTLA